MVCRDGVIATLRRCRRWVTCLLALTMFAAPAHAAWQRLDSPNFVVVGDASDRELRKIAIQFEAFRESVARLRSKETGPAAVPTIIVAFRSDKAFTPFKPRYDGRVRDVAGLFVGARDVNHIAFLSHIPFASDRADELRTRIIYHEYAHQLISDALPGVPAWLNEGLAELYSTLDITRDGRHIVVGRAIGHHLALLNRERLLKLPELLQVDYSSPLYDERQRQSLFYAQSWALVHMIQFGDTPRTKQLGEYLQRVSGGTPPPVAWAEAFGNDPIEAELEKYIRGGIYNAKKLVSSEKLSRFDAVAKPLSPLEVRAFLAQFLLAQGRVDEAAAQLAWDGKADERNATAAVLSAQLSLGRRDSAAALKALSGLDAPDDWLVAYYAGVTLTEAIARAPDGRPETVAAANRFFDAAARARSFPNAAIRRAALEIDADRPPPTPRSWPFRVPAVPRRAARIMRSSTRSCWRIGPTSRPHGPWSGRCSPAGVRPRFATAHDR